MGSATFTLRGGSVMAAGPDLLRPRGTASPLERPAPRRAGYWALCLLGLLALPYCSVVPAEAQTPAAQAPVGPQTPAQVPPPTQTLPAAGRLRPTPACRRARGATRPACARTPNAPSWPARRGSRRKPPPTSTGFCVRCQASSNRPTRPPPPIPSCATAAIRFASRHPARSGFGSATNAGTTPIPRRSPSLIFGPGASTGLPSPRHRSRRRRPEPRMRRPVACK